ncbi:MAG: DNA-processing protein DprA, partial [bacterium]
MRFNQDPPSLFSDSPDRNEWASGPDETACALELNTLGSFRTQFRKFKTRFKSFREIFEAPYEMFRDIENWADTYKKNFIEKKSKLTVGTELGKITEDIRIVTYFDCDYPEPLRDMFDPPPVLYVRGNISFNFKESISIVGSRDATEYGLMITDQFSHQLSGWGFTIISGGARGIDSTAHRSALNCGGKTIAVFGCGQDVIFPAENAKLFAQIAEKGMIISEFPMGTIPEKFNFPARNRIIAALGRGTLIVEAGEKSGALITAELAAQIGRDVFAIPGRLTDSLSKGTNMLIADGAHPVSCPSEIAERFGLIVAPSNGELSEDVIETLSADEAIVYESVGLEAKNLDSIVREIGLPAQRVISALLMLHTRNLVKELP